MRKLKGLKIISKDEVRKALKELLKKLIGPRFDGHNALYVGYENWQRNWKRWSDGGLVDLMGTLMVHGMNSKLF